jgi:hypothetical protein
MHKSRTRIRRLAFIAAAAAIPLGGVAIAASPASASTTACTSQGPSCGTNVNVYSNAFDVYQQGANYNQKIIAYPNSTTDRATDFVRSAEGTAYRYEYAPDGVLSGWCVSNPMGGGGVPAGSTGLVLRGCNTTAFQQFTMGAANSNGNQLTSVADGRTIQPNGTRAQISAPATLNNVPGSYWKWTAGTSTPPPPTYTKNGSYQFASNNGVTWQIGNSPVVTKEAAQSLGADGVDLSTAPDQGGPYADSGVIVKLGDLDSLFTCTVNGCTYVKPKIVGSPDLGVNFYFDSDGNGGYLSFTGGNTVYTGPSGDNLASAGAASGSLDPVDFSTFTQGNTSIGLSGSMAMTDVLNKYNTRTDGGTKDPEVWAWIGISGSTAQTGHVTSVDGTNLVSTSG